MADGRARRPFATLTETRASREAGWAVAAPAAEYSWPGAARLGSRGVDFRSSMAATLPELGVLALPAAIVEASEGWVSDRDGRLLPELSWYGEHIEELRTNECLAPAPEPTETLPGVCLALGSNWGSHFGHFVADAVGRLAVFFAAGYSFDDVDHVLVPTPPDSPDGFDLVVRAGLPTPKVRWLSGGAVYRGSCVLAPTYPGLRRQYTSLLPEYLRTLGRRGTGGRRLFVSRRGYTRNPVGIEVIEATALKAGFEIYDPMSPTSSFDDFADADAVVGVSGSALTSIAWCRRGTPVVELLSDAHLFPYYYSLAGAAGLRYGYLVGRALDDPPSRGPSSSDFVIDLAEFEHALDWVLASAD